ncbi:hypothetical protein GLW08_18030 [Pontibacillus yanchengensis]|uniref:Uncharacterized protein n=2 Tax=Pontibacillus yanchengensis TaxID=462910 RepID=A0ACC7VLZ4_9BACI|nr:FixH family protein [Pontibacillus yanchengensis]MYL35064.1 hypothetical protein [Pontibacillus yanchengensis]MYL55225.1 hypothetical protein [Pontibacillus yanchengensis]
MKNRMFLGMMLLMLFLAACESKPSSGEANESKHMEVQVMTVPEDIKSGEVSTLQAKVTIGGEEVNDVEKVKFELWKQGSTERQQRESKMQGKGMYSVQHIFEEKGVYNVAVSVTAQGLQKKVQKSVEVGDVNTDE